MNNNFIKKIIAKNLTMYGWNIFYKYLIKRDEFLLSTKNLIAKKLIE